MNIIKFSIQFPDEKSCIEHFVALNDSREKIIYMYYPRQNKKRINFALINYRLYEIEEEFI